MSTGDATAYGFTLTDPFSSTPVLSSSLDNSGGSNTSLPSGVSGDGSAALIPSTGNSFLDSVAKLTALGATAANTGLQDYTSFLNAETSNQLAAKGISVPSNTSATTVPLNNIPASNSATHAKLAEYALVAGALLLFWELMRHKK